MGHCINALQQTAFVIPSFGDLVKLTLVDLVRYFWDLRVVCRVLWAGLGRRALRRACEGLADVLPVPDVLPALLIQEMHGQSIDSAAATIGRPSGLLPRLPQLTVEHRLHRSATGGRHVTGAEIGEGNEDAKKHKERLGECGRVGKGRDKGR